MLFQLSLTLSGSDSKIEGNDLIIKSFSILIKIKNMEPRRAQQRSGSFPDTLTEDLIFHLSDAGRIDPVTVVVGKYE